MAAGMTSGPASRPRDVRLVGLVTALSGAAMVLAAPRVATFSGGAGPRPDPRIVRVLGARQVVQGAALVALPGRATTTASVLADTAHAASMIALAGGSARFRRPALISAAMAVTSAVAGRLVQPQRSGQ